MHRLKSNRFWVSGHLCILQHGVLRQPVGLGSSEGTPPVALPFYGGNIKVALQKEINILDSDTKQTEPWCQIFRGALGMTRYPELADLGKWVSGTAPPTRGRGLDQAHWLPSNSKSPWGRGKVSFQPLCPNRDPCPLSLLCPPNHPLSCFASWAKTILNYLLCVAKLHLHHHLCPMKSRHAQCVFGTVKNFFFSRCILEQSFMNPQQMFLSPFIFLFQRNCNRLCFN